MNKKRPQKKKVLPLFTPCPCHSGKTIAQCHFDPIWGGFRDIVPSITPPAPITNYSHARCYLRDTGDCSDKISGEHYISQSILDQLGSIIEASGMPWLKPGEKLRAPVSNFTANILCDRHNSALSPLDTEAGRFFTTLTDALVDLDKKTLSRKPTLHLAAGTALELWMLKVACGLYFSVGAANGERISRTYSIDMGKVRRAFFERSWDPGGGLYFSHNVGSAIQVAGPSVQMAGLFSDSNRAFGGVRVGFHGVEIELLFDTTYANPGPWTGIIHRPTELVFRQRKRAHYILLTWPPGTPERSVHMDGKKLFP